jgi:hypothetical protein
LRTTRLSICSISLSVPKPNVLIWRFEDAYTQRRWSREKGRSSSLDVTMYWRSSGPTASSQ